MFIFVKFAEVKYVNTSINAPESYSVPKGVKPMPKYLEIIYDENDDQPLPVNAYEIPLPPLDETEAMQSSSPTLSENSNNKSTESDSIKTIGTNKEENKVKSRTISSSSTVSETSVYNPPKKKEQLNMQPEDNDLSKTILTVALPNNVTTEDYTSNKKLLLPPPPPPQSNDISKRKLQQMYANTNIESAIRSCDGITSM